MNKLGIFLVIVFLISLTVLFLNVRSLPTLDEQVQNETSTLVLINNDLFQEIHQINFEISEQGRKQNFSFIQETAAKAATTINVLDSLNLLWDEAIADRSNQQLASSVKRLNTFFDFTYVDTTLFQRSVTQLTQDLEQTTQIDDHYLRTLGLENNRHDLLELFYEYLKVMQLSTITASVRFDNGFPDRPDTWKPGLIAFNPPAKMELNKKYRMQVKVSKDMKVELIEKLPESEKAILDSILVGDIMVVRLLGDEFDIAALDDEEQGVLTEGYTQWEFDVTPKSVGPHNLYVKAGIVYHVPNLGPTKKYFPVYEKTIEIKVDTLQRIVLFATERWEFLISTIIFPIITWGFSRVRRRKQKDDQKFGSKEGEH